MSVDKELIGTEFEYHYYGPGQEKPDIYKCFVAQADPEKGITGKPFDPQEMLDDGFANDETGVMNCVCVFKDMENFEGEYAEAKAEILEGIVILKQDVAQTFGVCAF